MSWIDLYFLVRQMTTSWRVGGRTCFAALVSAFLYHERFHTSNAVDHLAGIRRFPRRKAYRKIEKFLHRKTQNLDEVWQWLWNHYTSQLKDCFVLIDWTMWRDGRQVLMAALMHSGRCLPFLAVAYQVRKLLRSQNQAEHAFFLLLAMVRRSNQQITCINDRGFARISLVKQLRQHRLRFITRVCHNTYFSSSKYQGLLRDYQIKEGGLDDLGEGELGKDKKNQARLRLIVYRGRGHKAPWFIATDRGDLTGREVASLYARRMGIESGFRDTKGSRYGWGLKQIGLRSDVKLTVLWGAAMVATLCVKPASTLSGGKPALKPPTGYNFVWNDKGSGADKDGSCWSPIAPEGYVALGDVFATGYNEPSINDVMCVAKELNYEGLFEDKIWSDEGSGANRDFSSWQIKPTKSYVDSNDALIAVNSFVGVGSHTRPSSSKIANTLLLPVPVVESGEPQQPVLTSKAQPPQQTTAVIDRVVTVPFTAVDDGGKTIEWILANSPFYTIERSVYYSLILFEDNSSSIPQMKSRTVTTGISEEKSEQYSITTGITVGYETGVEAGGFSSKISVQLSLQLGYATTTSIGVFQNEEQHAELVTPPMTAAALWLLANDLTARRADGSAVAPGLKFDAANTSYITKQFPPPGEGVQLATYRLRRTKLR